jgi:hypothetical protein
LPGYERGRALMEVPAILEAAFLEAGVPASGLDSAASETDFLTRTLAEAHAGDLLLVLVHVERDEVGAWLASHRG